MVDLVLDHVITIVVDEIFNKVMYKEKRTDIERINTIVDFCLRLLSISVSVRLQIKKNETFFHRLMHPNLDFNRWKCEE